MEYYIFKDDKIRGPYSIDGINKLIYENLIDLETPVSSGGNNEKDDWRPLRETELSRLFSEDINKQTAASPATSKSSSKIAIKNIRRRSAWSVFFGLCGFISALGFVWSVLLFFSPYGHDDGVLISTCIFFVVMINCFFFSIIVSMIAEIRWLLKKIAEKLQ